MTAVEILTKLPKDFYDKLVSTFTSNDFLIVSDSPILWHRFLQEATSENSSWHIFQQVINIQTLKLLTNIWQMGIYIPRANK